MKKAFSLLELTIALVIFSIIFM
ncbi:prepilin-type N-terminal cleavage/methylation domain-containing protein, partial [Campylobacter upsaliensis]|nr:prepilin-type N-terminal cleavage/methylation domain-containing protein [Campylobacter upsaliensis]